MRSGAVKSFATHAALAAIMWILLFHVLFGAAIVQGGALVPRVCDGDFVLFFRVEAQYAAGDLVVTRIAGEREVCLVQTAEDGMLLLEPAQERAEPQRIAVRQVAGRVILLLRAVKL